jgi:Fe-S-cluster containining protein
MAATQSEIISSLRKSIPPVLCKPNCTDCCGAVPWSHWEWEQLPSIFKKGIIPNQVLVKPPTKGYRYCKAIIPLRYKLKGTSTIVLFDSKTWMQLYTKTPIKENKCVFLTDNEFGCRVYEFRPIICRLFATIMDERAACKHGCHSVPQLHWQLGIAMTLGWFNCMAPA